MFKIVIVDDDRQMQAIIRDKIKEKTDAFRDAKIQIFSSAEAFLAEAKQEEHGEEGDLFFVDIELGDGITGLEFGRILRKKYPNRGLVFLTSHKEFAMESYEIEADQYILKEQMDKRLPGIIINLRNVQSIRDNVICLEEGHTLELNQYRIEAAKKRIEAYWRERIWNEQPTS